MSNSSLIEQSNSSSSSRSSSISNIPPPLPDRSKSVEELTIKKRIVKSTTTIQDNPLGEHYAHLGKHVKEVRRRNRSGPPSPKLSDFQVRNVDKVVSTKWIEFLEAWIKYIVASAAYDEIDRPLEPFSLNTVKHDLDRICPMVVPFLEPAKQIRSVYRWENKALTGGMASIYLVLWYYNLILVFICAGMAIGIAWIRLDIFAQYGVDALEEQPETDASVKSWNRNFWMKMRTTMGTKSPYGFNLFDDIDINIVEWRNEIYTKYGPTIQIILSDTADYLERIKNLVTWKRPAKTRFLLAVVASSSVFLLFLPVRYIGKVLFLYIGFEFFVLQALRSYYPRQRRLFNVLNLLLWGVPNDAEYAMEVVQLNRNSNRTGTNKAAVINNSTAIRSDVIAGPPRAAVTKLSASMSNISTELAKTANDEVSKTPAKIKSGFQEAAASTTATLAMLAAVNKVKQTVDKKQKKKETESTNIVPPDDPNAFGCMYKGTIPGRIALLGNGFVFRTSRIVGSLVLVECAFNDIIGVKKTKQYDVVVWHSNGIDISMSDGNVLRFENVLRRDDCFNRLVSASNEEGDEWKKM